MPRSLAAASAFVSVPVAALAEALDTNPDDLAAVLDLAERLGALAITGDRVELPPHVVRRLDLVRDGDRWYQPNGPDALYGPIADRKRTVPLLYPETIRARTVEPWVELARAEEPPRDRVAAIIAWLDRQAAAVARRTGGVAG